MNVKIFLLMIICISSINSMDYVFSGIVKVISESYFVPPVDTHFIQSNTVKSLMRCTVLCSSHSSCRTADYNSSDNVCRLFESVSTMGTYLYDSTTSILAFNYCLNDTETEPEYVCTRSGTLTVQEIFDSLSSAPNMTFPAAARGAYPNAYGIYMSNSTGSITFITNANAIMSLSRYPGEVTGICPLGSNGLASVHFYNYSSTIYNNIGSLSEPQLVSILNISLSSPPYSCLTTSTYLYITYQNNYTIMTVHNLSTGALLNTVNYSVAANRPELSQWNDTIFIIDRNLVTEYDLTGIYKGNWNYPFGYQTAVRNTIYHDYAGRIYTCNANTVTLVQNTYAFLQNGTMIANGPGYCYRTFELYLTKDRATLINIYSAAGVIQTINFY